MDRPYLTIEEAIAIGKEIFDINVDIESKDKVKELVSYDDRNFYFHATKDNICGEYLLKIYNGSFCCKDVIHDVHKIMFALRDAGIVCPIPLKALTGDYLQVKYLPRTPEAKIRNKKPKVEPKDDHMPCIICLFTFVPGKTMKDLQTEGVSFPDKIYYEVGQLTGNIVNALKDVKSRILEERKFNWDIYYFDTMLKGKDLLNDNEKEMVDSVITSFKTFVKPKFKVLPKQCIHGDINDANILLENVQTAGEKFKVSGIIDFGDANHTCRVFDLAIATSYMMMVSKDDPVRAAALTVAGYNSICPLTQTESDIIFYCIQVRNCQSRCFGAHSSKLYPDNAEYLLYNSEYSLKCLEPLLKITKHDFNEMWKTISIE